MVSGSQRKFYMLGGKGGVGKTSCAASLAVKLANHGYPTIVVSTDPAHSLSDSFDQDLAGGMLAPVQGVDAPLYAIELNPVKAREELRSTKQHGGGDVRSFVDSMGLRGLADQVGELKLEELLDTPSPGLDEAIAISKARSHTSTAVVARFHGCIYKQDDEVLNMLNFFAPTGLTAITKKLASAKAAIISAFGKGEQDGVSSDKLEQLKESMSKVRDLFRDLEITEFVIVTIPTVMALSESSRLCASLGKENIPVKRLVVNQLLPPSTSDCKFCSMRR
ncbi:P-loop containing nucleoside triphosphate hydrolases superfamily protein [Perilla frutescens var. hirtella]|uniref:P-loop containing nucleoside triphosphate hydrolases superfamily protein n=1 Tax=Perilla frutescens var. hirtella TaxID=608512 RepID=A0AAD4J6A5_PERFH|nr:P-loop containing nucleoside triphosphate hydrolases superfamily protein [Perilla frutescens var. hirtella]